MKLKYILLFGIILALTSSCTERIDLDLDASDPVIVIYGTITDTLAYQSISVSSSVPYFEQAHNPAISGARATITSSDNEVWVLHESSTVKGLYQTDEPKAARTGQTYHLKVEYDFDKNGVEEAYEASSSLLPGLELDSVQIREMRHMGHNLFTVNIYAQDPAGEDFYINKYFVNDSLATKLSEYGLMDDKLIDGQYMNGLMAYFLYNINDIDDYDEEEISKRIFVGTDDVVTIELTRVEKKYYNFVRQAQQVKNGENPIFGGPPSNIQGNISNGAAGYFAAYSPSKVKAIVP